MNKLLVAFIWLILSLFTFWLCARSVHFNSDPFVSEARVDIKKFFLGSTSGKGLVFGPLGQYVSSFDIHLSGHEIDDNKIEVEEELILSHTTKKTLFTILFNDNDNSISYKVKSDPQQVGTGAVLSEQSSYLNVLYKLPTIKWLSFDLYDRYYIIDDHTLLVKTIISKWFIPFLEIQMVLHLTN